MGWIVVMPACPREIFLNKFSAEPAQSPSYTPRVGVIHTYWVREHPQPTHQGAKHSSQMPQPSASILETSRFC